MSYWAERAAKTQERLTTKNIKETQEQLRQYYSKTMKKVLEDFEATYDKLLNAIAEDKEPTPADLYKLDKYWQMQAQLKAELQALGDKQAALLSEEFVKQYKEIYEAMALKDDTFFNEVDRATASQMINQIWCADGKSWSSRIWKNTDQLQQALNDNLINCVVTGKKTTELKKLLQDQFKVSYNSADMLVRTEMAHIQTQAAQQRYKDYGVEEVEVWVDEDERTCPICAKHEGEKYPVNATMPVPFHPRCRCCMIPVIDDDFITEDKAMEDKKKTEDKRLEEAIKKRGMYYDKEKDKLEFTSKEAMLEGIKKHFPSAIDDKAAEMEETIKEKYNKFFEKTKNKETISSLIRGLSKELEGLEERAERMIIYDFYYCIDCGKPIPIEGKKSNAIKRCQECQVEYRKKKKAEYERQRRAKLKLNK